MSGPFKMKGFGYPGKAPAESPNKFSWKRARKAGIWSGGILGAIKGFKAGNTELMGFNTDEDDDPTFQNDRENNLSATVDNPADDVTVENEIANISDEEKDEIVKKVVKSSTGGGGGGDPVTGAATIV